MWLDRNFVFFKLLRSVIACTSILFQTLKCHNKQTSDFAFVGSSSFIATAGHSSDGR